MGENNQFTPCTGIYKSGPFAGHPVSHPYNTVLSRFREIGVSIPDRLVGETPNEYILRLDRTYAGILSDVVAEQFYRLR